MILNLRELSGVIDQTVAKLGEALPTSDDKLDFVTGCLATAIAIKLPLPAAPVEGSSVQYYNSQYATNAERLAAEVNEVYAIDMVKFDEFARAAWVNRYEMVHNPNRVLALMLGDGKYAAGGSLVAGFIQVLGE